MDRQAMISVMREMFQGVKNPHHKLRGGHPFRWHAYHLAIALRDGNRSYWCYEQHMDAIRSFFAEERRKQNGPQEVFAGKLLAVKERLNKKRASEPGARAWRNKVAARWVQRFYGWAANA
jgi:hypothetical protein